MKNDSSIQFYSSSFSRSFFFLSLSSFFLDSGFSQLVCDENIVHFHFSFLNYRENSDNLKNDNFSSLSALPIIRKVRKVTLFNS